MPPPFIRLASPRCNFAKFSFNRRWKSVRSVSYHSSSDAPTSLLCHRLGKFNNVIETLDQLNKQPSLFITQLKESGFKHDVETYMTIARLLCHSDADTVRLSKIFMYVVENPELVRFEISDLLRALIEEKLIKAVDVLVKVYASLGRFEEAIHTLSEAKTRSNCGLLVSTPTCNFVMNKLIEWEKLDMVELVYRQLERNGLIIPNVHTYGILMKAYCSQGNIQAAEGVFLDMMMMGEVFPDAHCYGVLIRVYCENGDSVKALGLCVDMEARGIIPNHVIVRSLVECLCGMGKLDDAVYLLKYFMESSRVNFIDRVTFKIAIDAAWKLGRMDDAMWFVQGLKERKDEALENAL